MSVADRLATQRQGIFAILDEAEAMLRDTVTRDIAGLARARWSLMRALTAYDMSRNGELLDPFIARAAGADALRAQRLRQAGAAAVEAFRGNVTRWSAADVVAVWPTYQASALAMIARLREHFHREPDELAPLVRSNAAAATPPPAAPPRRGPPTPAG